MIKRPLNPQFSSAILEGRKFTTIREKPWPVGKPCDCLQLMRGWCRGAIVDQIVDVLLESLPNAEPSRRDGGKDSAT